MRHANEDKKNAETAIVIYFNEQHLASPRVQIVRGAEGIGGGGNTPRLDQGMVKVSIYLYAVGTLRMGF